MNNTEKVISCFFEREETNADKHAGRRDKSYYRTARRNNIARKKKISKNIYNGWSPDHDGYLNKGKVHCSCWMCSFHGTPIQDLKRIDSMNDSMNEYRKDSA